MLALALINYGLDDELTAHSQITNTLVYLGVAVAVMGVGLLVTGVTATQFTAIIAVMMIALIALNIYQSVSSPDHQPEH